MAGIETVRTLLTEVSGAVARSSIAAALGSSRDDVVLGTVRLHPHQVQAVDLVRRAIREFGGALLCDPVGTGKTFTALAVAKHYARVVVVAPAVLKEMWTRAAMDGAVRIGFVSHERLSRAFALDSEVDCIIVDEAHHARNPATKRFAALSSLARSADVLLLTATPIHNRPRDLQTIVSLFLGARAQALTETEVSRIVVRREERLPAGSAVPESGGIEWLSLGADDEIAELLLSLPPPLPPREGSGARALVVHSLVRMWASSDAALAGGLRRRRQRAHALIAALESGTYPSRDELRTWLTAEDGIQLGFAELLAPQACGTRELLSVLRIHASAIDELLQRVVSSGNRDCERAKVICDIRARHQDVPIVAFSQYADTVESIYRATAGTGQVAMLRGKGGRVAGGTISKGELIRRFAPVAAGAPRPDRAFRVSFLTTTDILSEGVNLQDAGCVVHLDLPYTFARMEQRLGRIVRIGSPHLRVWQYAFHPPASAELITRIEALIGAKLTFSLAMRSSPLSAELVRSRIASWYAGAGADGVVATVNGGHSGFLAALSVAGESRLLCCIDGRITDVPEPVLLALGAAEGDDLRTERTAADAALRMIETHLRAERALVGTSTGRGVSALERSRMLRRVSRIIRSARPHLRPAVTALAARARDVLSGRLGAGMESELATIELRELSDVDWLECVVSCRVRETDPAGDPQVKVVGLILF
jgi:hypothetical protein